MPSFAALLRRTGLVLFRAHIGNGLAVALGLAVVGVGFALWGGLAAAVGAATGALCMSVVDQPGPLRPKPVLFLATLILTTAIAFLSALTKGLPLPTGAVIAVSALIAGLMTAYGKRAIGPGIAMMLALVLAMGTQSGSLEAVVQHTALFAGGALAYALFALAYGFAFEDWDRRLLLIEALLAFSNYLRAKAALYEPDAQGRGAFRGMIEVHSVLIDKLQAARDSIFDRVRSPKQRRRADALIALSDAFETMLSTDADIDILERSTHRHLMRRIHRLTCDLADDAETLSISLHHTWGKVALPSHDALFKGINDEIARIDRVENAEEIAAFRATAEKLGQASRRMTALTQSLNGDLSTMPSKLLDLIPFMQPQPTGFSVLRSQFSIASPTLRYAIRLTLAMLTGYALTRIVPQFAHGTWVLLTIALIMRANYSVTRQRRTDRVVGTLVGCVIAAGLVHYVPAEWLIPVIVVSVAVSHAYGAVAYRITAVSASVTALLLLHLLSPNAHPLFMERILDTLVGAAISYVFSFLLPSWERRDLPRMIKSLLAADSEFARQALTSRSVDQFHRLARKRVLDAVGAMSSAARRLADEPNSNARVLASLNELLGANYLLASDLASVQRLLLARAGAIDLAHAEELLAMVRTGALETLASAPSQAAQANRLRRITSDELMAANATTILRRRLVHIEKSAGRVAALAARTLRFAAE